MGHSLPVVRRGAGREVRSGPKADLIPTPWLLLLALSNRGACTPRVWSCIRVAYITAATSCARHPGHSRTAEPRPHSSTEPYCPVLFDKRARELMMPSSQLKRAERAIATIRHQSELPPETADAIAELVEALRTVERRLAILENGGRKPPTARRVG